METRQNEFLLYTQFQKFFGTLLLLVIFASGYSQQEIISTTTQYITSNKFARANQYLDSILNKNPKNVDALVMKGNVLLNYAWQNTSRSYFDIERAESVFDTSAEIDQSFFTPVIPEDTSKLIELYWLECLSIDSSRIDIQKGLCNLYSISLRVPELKSRLMQMKNVIATTPDNAFVYAEYARNLKTRGRFEEGMEIYRLIADMFPSLAGIRCDMAGEYFYAGKPKEALQYLDSTLKENNVDQTSFINSASIYSMLGYYDEALKTLERYSKEDTVLAATFYKGLLQFAGMDSNCFTQLNIFIQQGNEQNYFDEWQLAKRLLSFTKTGFTFQDYRILVSDSSIPDYYKVLIYQRAMQQFKDSCKPMMNYGTFQCRNRNYPAAAQFLEGAENCGSDSRQKDYWTLDEGYSLYMNGEKEKALASFSLVIASDIFFIRQAAQYLAAKILAETGNKKEASELLGRITYVRSATKYGYLAAHFRSTVK